MAWHTRVRIPRSYQALLSQLPLATPMLIRLENPQQVALAMRVSDLFVLRRTGTTPTAQLVGYQGKEGVWVVALVFGLISGRATLCSGTVYLNPKRAADLSLLRPLTIQERLPFVFSSPRCTTTVRRDGPWSVRQRQEARMLLARLDLSCAERDVESDGDPMFEAAKAEFQRLYPSTTFLSPYAQPHILLSAPFHGAVLD